VGGQKRSALIVVGSVNIRRNRSCKIAAELLLVRAIGDIDEPLGVGVAQVAVVRRAEVDLVLAEGRRDAIWEDAGGEARDDLLYARRVRCVQHVVVDVNVIA